MEVNITPDQDAFIRQAIRTGRLHRTEEAVEQAMLLWEERERRRLEILGAVDLAEGSLARGEGRKVTSPEEAAQLVEDVRQRGMARFVAEKSSLG